MRIFLYLDNDKPVLMVCGLKIKLSNREFDNLFYDMKMVAKNGK